MKISQTSQRETAAPPEIKCNTEFSPASCYNADFRARSTQGQRSASRPEPGVAPCLRAIRISRQSKIACIRSKLNTNACREDYGGGRRAPGALVAPPKVRRVGLPSDRRDRKSTRLNSSHLGISYAV